MLDVDSTLCGVEGVDWLAQRRSAYLASRIAQLTDRAMNGAIPLEAAYGDRLALIRPSREDVLALAAEYCRTIAPGAAAALERLRSAGVRLILVSGGVRQAILPVARQLDFAPEDLFAVDVAWTAGGEYSSFDESSPLTTHAGKNTIVRSLALPPPSLAVGDGATDAEMRTATDAFAAYTGFVRRESVVRLADFELASFAELEGRVLAR